MNLGRKIPRFIFSRNPYILSSSPTRPTKSNQDLSISWIIRLSLPNVFSFNLVASADRISDWIFQDGDRRNRISKRSIISNYPACERVYGRDVNSFDNRRSFCNRQFIAVSPQPLIAFAQPRTSLKKWGFKN